MLHEVKELVVGGVVSLTTVDYPGHLAVVVFCQGCPWKCRYCHNKHLRQLNANDGLPWKDVVELIKTRKNFIDSVVFSGGEPLIQNDLQYAIEEIKNLDLLIGLHTSGAVPIRFAKIVSLLDWVGLDVKAPFQNYKIITNIEQSGKVASESLDILLASGVSYEVRITLDPILTIDDINDVLKELYERGVQTVALQNVRTTKNVVVPHPFLSNLDVMTQAQSMFKNLIVRNT